MKALVFIGPGVFKLVDRPQPSIDATTDAIVRVTHTTICGTDLHILKGHVPTCEGGRILGHEGVGIVEAVGAGVTAFRPRDRVLISCITSCARCAACRRGMYSHCAEGGWILGNRIDGTQAEFVRVPHADTSLHRLPADGDAGPLAMLSDILPTGYECGVLNGRLTPGCSVAIVGAGPIGLATLMTARFFSPATVIMIDLDDHRLDIARELGATGVVNSGRGDAAAEVRRLTDGRGVDAAIEAVGAPATFQLCEDIVAVGGTIANIGVHGSKVDLHLERLWSHNISITTRLVDTISTPMLIQAVAAARLTPSQLITHRFPLAEIASAYDTFARATATEALKVIVEV